MTMKTIFLRQPGRVDTARVALAPQRYPTGPMSDFSTDHPVEALRGWRRLSATKCRMLLLQRSLWLQKKIAEREAERKPADWHRDELAAIEQALELIDE